MCYPRRYSERLLVSGLYGTEEDILTLPMKFDAVQKKTTRRSNKRPSVWRASPTNFGFGLPDPFEETTDRIEDLEVCNSSEGPESWLEVEFCLRPLRRGRSPALIATQNEIPTAYIVVTGQDSHDTLSRKSAWIFSLQLEKEIICKYGKENQYACCEVAPISSCRDHIRNQKASSLLNEDQRMIISVGGVGFSKYMFIRLKTLGVGRGC
jgi:hypothetical protein